jgi:CTP:molybdopterin cytidylyltransferase MocA
MKHTKIVPIVLAAGSSQRFGFPKPLARFGQQTALEIAVKNCRELGRPIVVLGSDAAEVRKAMPRGVRAVLNRRWRRGQLSSLLAALRHVPKSADFAIYPVDHPLLTREIVMKLVRAFRTRPAVQAIVMPRFKRRPGHPVICAAVIRQELAKAKTAKMVVFRKPQRIRYVEVRSAGIYLDFATPETYVKCLQLFPGPKKVRRKRS